MTFYKGSREKTAETWSEHYQLIWEGWTASGPAVIAPAANVTSAAGLTGVVSASALAAAMDGALAARIADAASAIRDALDAEYVAGPPSVLPTDGQLLEWDAATERFVPINPVGNSELAVAENITGTVTAISSTGGAGTIVAIPGTAISVPDSGGRVVSLVFEAGLIQAATGPGTAFLMLYETTGAAVSIANSPIPLPNSTAVSRSQVAWPMRSKRIGVVTTTRTFELRAYIYADAATTPTANVRNHTTAPTLLTAVAG